MADNPQQNMSYNTSNGQPPAPMSYNTPDGKPPDHKQIMLDMIAAAHGPQAAMVADKAFKTQDKQIEAAMIDHGMTAEDVLKGIGVDTKRLAGGLNDAPKMEPSKGLFSSASVTPEGNIQDAGALGGIFGTNTHALLKNLLTVSEIKKNSTGSMASQLGQMKEDEKNQNTKDIADAMENGSQLADFKSLYGLAGPVKAELSRRGVNVAKLQLQATAENKLAQTLNGPQQVRLRQSVDSVLQGLDELDSLNSEFDRTGIKLFNKGKLEFLANGGGTPEQQEIAQRYKTQMIGLQDEFGNVVMAGNSPTDRALELSAKIFNSDFNNTAISASTKQMRRLLSMRKSAIDNVGSNSGQIDSKSNNPNQENIKQSSSSYNDFRKAIGR